MLATGKLNWITPLTIDPNILAIENMTSQKDLSFTVNDLVQAQLSDPVTSHVIHYMENGRKPLPKDLLYESPAVNPLLRDWPKLVRKDGLLKRNIGTLSQIVLHQKYHRLVINELHENMGHLRLERVLDLARQRLFWSRMQVDIEHFMHNVCTCLKQKRPTFHTRAPLQPIITTSPFEMISIEFCI